MTAQEEHKQDYKRKLKLLAEPFQLLANDNLQKRLNGATQLLQRYTVDKAYVLKRLVRGCGASSNVSRLGFYTALLGILKSLPATELPLELVYHHIERELHDDDRGEAHVGRMLICEAILRAGRLASTSDAELVQFVNLIVSATRVRNYLATLGYGVLIAALPELRAQTFKAAIWPQLLQSELLKAPQKLDLVRLHCLLAINEQYAGLIEASVITNLLSANNYEHVYRLCFEQKCMIVPPGFGLLLARLPNFSDFWLQFVSVKLEQPKRQIENIALALVADILSHPSLACDVRTLLSASFMSMIIAGLQRLKQRKDDKQHQTYAKFTNTLAAYCKELQSEEITVAVIKLLTMPPSGLANIEDYTSTRLIHSLISLLQETGVKTIYASFEQVFVSTTASTSAIEKSKFVQTKRAGFMLQQLLAHESVQQDIDWRQEKLQFFFKCGNFHVNDELEICKPELASYFSKHFGEQCKAIFYKSVQGKLTDLKQEQRLLRGIFDYANTQLARKHCEKFLRAQKFDGKALAAWRSVETKLKEQKKSKNKQVLSVLSILLINMALLLLNDAETAQEAISDLIECMARADKQSRKSEEPFEWIEVLIDIFLQLLLKETSALRNLVSRVFSLLCEHVSIDVVREHLLVLLDLKNGDALNQGQAEESDTEDGDEKDADEHESAAQAHKRPREDDEEDSEDDDDDDDEDEDDDDVDVDEEDEEEEHISRAEELRNDISQAILETGINAKYANGDNDDDCASIDLNELGEEDGKRLDEAILCAFKAKFKPPDSTKTLAAKKSARGLKTSTLHFRMRVLDLLDIYLQKRPQLLAAIEILLALLGMLEHCVEPELQLLKARGEKLLGHILARRRNYVLAVEEVESVEACAAIVESLRALLQLKPNYTTHVNRDRCIYFIIAASVQHGIDMQAINALLEAQIPDFINSRNPSLDVKLMSDILRLNWAGLWKLVQLLVDQGMNAKTRAFRRIQVYELLICLYRNKCLQDDTGKAKVVRHLSKLESKIVACVSTLLANAPEDGGSLSAKEFQTLLECLLQAHATHQRLCVLDTSVVFSDTALLQALRDKGGKLQLPAQQVYKRFCTLNTIAAPAAQVNGVDPVEAKVTGHNKKSKAANEAETASSQDALNNGSVVEEKLQDKQNTKKTKKAKRRRLNGENE